MQHYTTIIKTDPVGRVTRHMLGRFRTTNMVKQPTYVLLPTHLCMQQADVIFTTRERIPCHCLKFIQLFLLRHNLFLPMDEEKCAQNLTGRWEFTKIPHNNYFHNHNVCPRQTGKTKRGVNI